MRTPGEESCASVAPFTTGAERPSSPSTDDNLVADPSVSAQIVTDHPSWASEARRLPQALRSPRSGSQPWALTVGVAGLSATGTTLSTGAAHRASRRS
jgi:hypothetical protein